MFLENIGQILLLVHDPETNILKQLPLAVQIKVCSQIVTFLKDASASVQVLLHENHVKWMMECVGQSFHLPIEEEDVIQNAIEIYRNWLIGTDIPQPILDNPQYFYQRMLKHFSLIFDNRNVQFSSLESRHLLLCERVLHLFETLGREYSEKLSEETWEILLRVMLGVTDFLMRSNLGNEVTLGEKLRPLSVRVLFELWLRSMTRNPELWQNLQNLVPRWGHQNSAVVQWRATSIALTARMMRIVYGPKVGADKIRIKIEQDDCTFELPEDDVIFMWHRFLHILGDPNCLGDPVIFREAMQGIKEIVLLLLSAGEGHDDVTSPQGNTIFHLLGTWLFEAVSIDTDNFEDGRALAFESICRVFCVRGQDVFHDEYMSNFYRALIGGLCSEDGRIISAIIMNTTTLFHCELEGRYSLVPAFLYVVERILRSQDKPYQHIPVSIDRLRASCIAIINMLIFLPQHYGELALNSWIPKTEEGDQGADKYEEFISNYSEFPLHVSATLIKAITVETDPKNQQRILLTMSTFIQEYSNMLLDFHDEMFKTFEELIFMKQSIHSQVVATAMRVMRDLTICYDDIHSRNAVTIPRFVRTLCLYIDNNITNPKKRNLQESTTLICLAYETLLAWILCGSWLLREKQVIVNVLRALDKGITGGHTIIHGSNASGSDEQPVSPRNAPARQKPGEGDPSAIIDPRVKESAEMALMSFLGLFGTYPTPVDPHRLSTLRVDTSTFLYKYTRFFALNSTVILSVVERPSQSDISISLVARSPVGKFSWDGNFIYNLKEEEYDTGKIESPENSDEIEGPLQIFNDFAYDEQPDPINCLTELLPEEHGKSNMGFQKLLRSQSEIERKLLDEKLEVDRTVSTAVDETQPPDIYLSDVKFQNGRILLQNFGFLTLEMLKENLQVLRGSEELFQELTDLDRMGERLERTAAFTVVKENQTRIGSVLKNEAPEEAENFLRLMCEPLELHLHQGFKGRLSSKFTKDGIAFYRSSVMEEFILHTIPHLVGLRRRQEFMESNQVQIVWNLNSENSLPEFYSKYYVNIVIYPLENRMYKIDVIRNNPSNEACNGNDVNSPIPIFGPLLDGTVVSKNKLGQLVYKTVVAASEAVDQVQRRRKKIYNVRREKILRVVEEYGENLSPAQVYSSFFSAHQSNG